MLDVALINLVSAGIERVCRPPVDGARVDFAEFDREVLIRQLSEAEPETMGRLIADVVEEIWSGCRAVGLPAELAEPHIAVLPDILHDAHLRAADHAMFCNAGHVAPDNAVADLSRRIVSASDIDCASAELDETVLTYLLECFLASLFASRALIHVLLPHVSALRVPLPSPEAVAEADKRAVTLAKIKRAGELGIPVPILDAITVSLINLTRSAELLEADVLAAAADARELADAFEGLSRSTPEHADLLGPLSGMFRAGRLADCYQLLATAEDLVVKNSVDTSAHQTEHTAVAIELRTRRAELTMLEGAFTKAARHYGFAQRYIPRAEFEVRWYFAELEAEAYEAAAFRNGDGSGLENAARACTSALATIPSDKPSVTLATAQTCLGHILILLGEKEQQADRFELAGQLLSDAQTVLDALSSGSGLARRAAMLRATAIGRLGVFLQYSALIEQAIQLYQSAIENGDRQGAGSSDDPDLIASVSILPLRLALAMTDYAALEQAEALRERAIAAIEAGLPGLVAQQTSCKRSDFDRCLLVARSHTALANWYRDSGNDTAGEMHEAEAARHLAVAGMGSTQHAGRLPAPNIVPPDTQPAHELIASKANAA